MKTATLWMFAHAALLLACARAPRPVVKDTRALPAQTALPNQKSPLVHATLESVGLDPLAMDRSQDPCIDFYQYACGGWLKHTEIPADEPTWARSWHEVKRRTELELKRILEEAAKSNAEDEPTQKLGAFYLACMDEAATEKADSQPIQALLKVASGVRDSDTLTAAVAELHAAGIWPLFELSPTPDSEDATSWIANLDQGGLGLPDRDYYIEGDKDSQELRATYRTHVANVLHLSGFTRPAAQSAAADVVKLETALAMLSKTKVERRDPKGMTNRLDSEAVAKVTPSFNWQGYWAQLGLPRPTVVNVTSPKFFEGLQSLMLTTKPAVWRNYLAWHILHGTGDLLSKRFVDESFHMEQALSGQPEPPVRWRRCVRSTNQALGDLLGQPFVKDDFPGTNKQEAASMLAAIGSAFMSDLQQFGWMDATTKARAREKASAVAYLIGYPSNWKKYDYSIDAHSFARNTLNSQRFEQKREFAKIGRRVDREEWWDVSATTVNAYYYRQRNQMVFPAAVLQRPFYGSSRSIAVNLGAIGMVFGHELTHGFDDRGSQFDASGNLVNWWSPAARQQFNEKVKCVADQYSAYEALPGLHINGKLTLGENIADGGGLKLAFEAYRALRRNASEIVVADGMSEDQQFFLSFGQLWCEARRPEFERLSVQTNPHSPARFRVRGALMNFRAFADAYECKEGSPMRPRSTCSVW